MRIALFGDSQAGGLAPHLARLLAPDVLVYSSTRSGFSTGRFLDAENWISAAETEPDLALVVLGGNDTASSSYGRTLARAMDTFKEIAPRVVWIGPSHSGSPEVAARHDATRVQQAQILPGLGATFLDPRVWQTGPAGRHSADGTHFLGSAYAAQAAVVVAELRGLNRTSWGSWAALAAGVALAVGIGYAAAQR